MVGGYLECDSNRDSLPKAMVVAGRIPVDFLSSVKVRDTTVYDTSHHPYSIHMA